MNIAFLAHDKKKELMVQFCTAYKSVLSKHKRNLRNIRRFLVFVRLISRLRIWKTQIIMN